MNDGNQTQEIKTLKGKEIGEACKIPASLLLEMAKAHPDPNTPRQRRRAYIRQLEAQVAREKRK